MNFEQFAAYIDGDTVGNFNMHNTYSFEISTFKEIREDDRVVVQLVYAASKFNHFSLGSSLTVRLYQYVADKKGGEKKTKTASHTAYELPIFIH